MEKENDILKDLLCQCAYKPPHNICMFLHLFAAAEVVLLPGKTSSEEVNRAFKGADVEIELITKQESVKLMIIELEKISEENFKKRLISKYGENYAI